MNINGFSLQIHPGTEDEHGYVEIPHNTQYTIRIGNNWVRRALATIEVDGKFVGRFVVPSNNQIRLETNESNGGKFTFLQKGTDEFAVAELHQVITASLGVVTCSIAPETAAVRSAVVNVLESKAWRRDHVPQVTTMNYTSGGSGGTGLTGQSRQTFQTVSDFPLDESERTVISLRLIPPRLRPLKPTVTFRGNPVPPPLQ